MPCNVNELFLRAHLLNALEATELYLVLVTGIGVGYSLERVVRRRGGQLPETLSFLTIQWSLLAL